MTASTATIMIISGFRASSSRHYFRCRLSLSPYFGSLPRRLHASHASPSPLHRYHEMVEMTRRRIHENGNGNADSANKAKSPTGAGAVGERGERHDQPHTHSHSHSHSHGIFGGHSHSHGHDGHDHGGGLVETLQSGGAQLIPLDIFVVYLRWFTRHILSCCFTLCEGDRGSRVTLVGLGANVLLTSAKGAAGWYMNSAALLADAGHAISGEHALPTSCPSSLSSTVLSYVSLAG